MNQQIHEEIAALQSELERLNTAVKHIEDAGKLARSISQTGQSLGQKYTLHLEEIKELVTQYDALSKRTEKLTSQINAIDFPDRFKGLETTINGIYTTLQDIQSQFEKKIGKTNNEIGELKTLVRNSSEMYNQKISKVMLWVYLLGGLMALNFLVMILG